MLMAAKMSQNFSLISKEDFLLISSHLEKCGFVIDPTKIRKNWNEKNLINHLFKDKKNEGKNLTFILLNNIGKAFVRKGVELKEFQKVLKDFNI
jgi:3-dehydroquinate synthetase